MTAEPSTQQGLSGSVQVETTEAAKEAISALVLPQNPRRWLLLEADMQSPPELHIVQIRPQVLTAREQAAVRALEGDGWSRHVGYDGVALMKQGVVVPKAAEDHPGVRLNDSTALGGSLTLGEDQPDLEQENAALRRLLADLVREASDLDAWVSGSHTQALEAAREYLAAVTS